MGDSKSFQGFKKLSGGKPSSKPNRSNQAHRSKKNQPVLSPEEQAKILKIQQEAVAAAKAETERVEAWGKSLPGMSFRQLRGELKRLIRKEHVGKPPQPLAGLNIAGAIVNLIVLEGTKTKENPFAKLSSYLR